MNDVTGGKAVQTYYCLYGLVSQVSRFQSNPSQQTPFTQLTQDAFFIQISCLRMCLRPNQEGVK